MRLFSIKNLVSLLLLFFIACDALDNSTEPTKIEGCMDSSACNYNPNAISANDNCIYTKDCFGVCGGNAKVDACGVCDGETESENQCSECPNNQSLGCDGSCSINALFLDECNICGGDGIEEGKCDCSGNILDECNICGGDGIEEGKCDCSGNMLDECNICDGDGSTCEGYWTINYNNTNPTNYSFITWLLMYNKPYPNWSKNSF